MAVMRLDNFAVMSTAARVRYLSAGARVSPAADFVTILRKEMEFERAFVQAGGLLIAGLDPTGNGGIVAGFGDLRQMIADFAASGSDLNFPHDHFAIAANALCFDFLAGLEKDCLGGGGSD